jgi:acyl-CoA thioesterase
MDDPGSSRERVLTMMAADRASAALGIELVEFAQGSALVRMTVREDMCNGYDLAHGGLVFALADTAFACACNSWGRTTVAAGAEITFVAAAPPATCWKPTPPCGHPSGVMASTT